MAGRAGRMEGKGEQAVGRKGDIGEERQGERELREQDRRSVEENRTFSYCVNPRPAGTFLPWCGVGQMH